MKRKLQTLPRQTYLKKPNVPKKRSWTRARREGRVAAAPYSFKEHGAGKKAEKISVPVRFRRIRTENALQGRVSIQRCQSKMLPVP
jgi:hypothetical protein